MQMSYILTLSHFNLHCTKIFHQHKGVLCVIHLKCHRMSDVLFDIILMIRQTCHLNVKVLI